MANSTYINFQNIPQNEQIDQIIEDIGLKPEHYTELIYNLTYDRTYEPNFNERIRCMDGAMFIHVRQVLKSNLVSASFDLHLFPTGSY